MRKQLWLAGIAVAALLPTAAFAQQTCEQRRDARVATGTVIGGIAGALLGNAVAQHGGKSGGAVLGGVAGAVAGNQLSRQNNGCDHAYGYYDNNGQWHANATQTADAAGYYDRNGNWVDGAPDGYYDSNGNWIRTSTDVSADARGYRDANGRWIPASANGYYDSDGQYVAGSASGYYDSDGRWIAGPARGHYDASGRWINGEPLGHRDSNGVWVADAQPGYWDGNGHWHSGQTMGYYDPRGRWIDTSGRMSGPEPRAGYTTVVTDRWSEAGADTRSREHWLDARIRREEASGALDRHTANRALQRLAQISRDDSHMRRHHGELSADAQASIQERLDALANDVRLDNRR